MVKPLSVKAYMIREKKKGTKFYEYGTRLMEYQGEAKTTFATRHLTDSEYEKIKPLLDGVMEKRP
jgi:hypothetical protein